MNKESFSPSVNIIRDINKSLHYIPTSNTKRIYNQILNSYSTTSARSFNLIGSYGTGKSAFLLAFERQLTQGREQELYFGKLNGAFKGIKNFDFINIVGDYSSIIESFANKINIKKDITAENVIQQFDKYYQKKHDENNCVLIIIDEFGKHLEYAVSNEPEREMYFIQLLAEYVNDSRKNILFITTLHQNLDAYGATLDNIQRQEWNKVRGRLKELPFVEPVEQLLTLAADHITQAKFSKDYKTDYNDVLQSIENAKLFPLKTGFTEELARKLYPLDILAASVLTIALQKYGQNERSLFSFLLTNDYLGINDYNFQDNDVYHLSAVYDYLLHNYYSFLFTKYNPHYTQWAAIRSAIERVEGMFSDNIVDTCNIVKTIGLINIFSPESSVLNDSFLENYGLKVLKINSVKTIIDELVNKKIIRYAEYKKKYILFEGSDLDIDLALKEAEVAIDINPDLLSPLNEYFDFPYIAAKSVQYETGSPRFFEFCITSEPITKHGKNKIDGFINLVLSYKIDNAIEVIQSLEHGEAILYGVYHNTKEISNILWEIDKIKHVIENIHDDFVAKRELQNLLSYQIDQLNSEVFNSFYNNNIRWFFNKTEVQITNPKQLNKILSDISRQVYPYTPIFKNELINRNKLPASITVARKNFFKALVENWAIEDLGFPGDKYPPEKMIYITLLKNTGIHSKSKGGYGFSAPKNYGNFNELWKESINYLRSTKTRKRSIAEFYDVLSKAPFHLKRGFIDFWIPAFLFMQRDDYSLFLDDRYIPFFSEEIMELIVKTPKNVSIKAFNIDGVKLDLFHKYQEMVNDKEGDVSNNSFINAIRPFLVFYKNLPEYSKQTKNLNLHTQRLREAIALSKEPEKTFFEDFPRSLGFVDIDLNSNQETLKNYIEKLQNSINEIKSSYDNLLSEIEAEILDALGFHSIEFEKLITKISKRFISIKENRLAQHQRTLLTRLTNTNVDRIQWISSIVQVLIGKPASKLIDGDVPIVCDRIKEAVKELDDLCDLANADTHDNTTNLFKFTLTEAGKGAKSRIIHITDKKKSDLQNIKNNIANQLTDDRDKNIEVLLSLIHEELNK